MERAVRPFTAVERERLRAAWAAGLAPECPRCAVKLDAQDVRPHPAVSYVRHRRLVICPSCGGHGVVDRSEEE